VLLLNKGQLNKTKSTYDLLVGQKCSSVIFDAVSVAFKETGFACDNLIYMCYVFTIGLLDLVII